MGETPVEIPAGAILTFEEQVSVSDEALKEHYRETMDRKRVPSDYMLMFTEGGESLAIAEAVAKAQILKLLKKGYQPPREAKDVGARV